MIKVKIKDISIEINPPAGTTLAAATDDFLRIAKELNISQSDVKPSFIVGEALSPLMSAPRTNGVMRPIEEPEDREVIRDRLPNLPKNVVDLSQLDISTAKAKQVPYFRCPSCGQSHVMCSRADKVIRIIDAPSPTLGLLHGGMVYTNYEDAIENITDTGILIANSDDILGYCPVCDKQNPLSEWVNAWENPLDYFECENPCSKCGSETVMFPTEPDKLGLKCDNENCSFTEIKGVR